MQFTESYQLDQNKYNQQAKNNSYSSFNII